MSNVASFAVINGRVRCKSAPIDSPDALANYFEFRKLDRLERMLAALRGEMGEQTRALDALRAFGLPQDLPQSTNGKTTITPARILPVEMTETLHRGRDPEQVREVSSRFVRYSEEGHA